MRTKFQSRKVHAAASALLLSAVAAVAVMMIVPSAALGKAAGTCNGLEITSFSPKQGARDTTIVTIMGSHLEGSHYLNTFFKEKNGWQWVHHSDENLTTLGQGYFTALVPDRAITGPIRVRDGSGCTYSTSKNFVVVDGK